MLILARKPGESIIINENITVTILASTYGRVRVGIDAPEDVSVNREEIQQRIDDGVPFEPKEVCGNKKDA